MDTGKLRSNKAKKSLSHIHKWYTACSKTSVLGAEKKKGWVHLCELEASLSLPINVDESKYSFILSTNLKDTHEIGDLHAQVKYDFM